MPLQPLERQQQPSDYRHKPAGVLACDELPLPIFDSTSSVISAGHFSVYPFRVMLSVVLITQNEEANLPRTLESVMPLVRDGRGEIIVVDSGSTDRTLEIARSYRCEGLRRAVERLRGAKELRNGEGIWRLGVAIGRG